MAVPSNFCPAPFIQLRTSKNGTCGPCTCRAAWKIQGKLSEQWQSSEINSLRQSFLENKKNSHCVRCWKEEDVGKKSLRLRLREFRGTKNLEKIFEKYIKTEKYKKFPRVLTLMPGNECNLACPTCSGRYSSKWNSLTSTGNYGPFHKVETNWNLTDSQYQDIVDNSQNLQKIELFGGEPFLNKRNRHNLIEKIIKKGTAKNIKLYFNTNGTIFNANYMESLAKNFKFVEIRQSIDGLHNEFEYLRYGANFDNVIKNAKKFSSLPNTDFQIICTVSIFNLVNLEKFDQYMSNKKWSVYYNIADRPTYLLLHNLPENVKKQIKLSSKFKDIEQYMNLKQCKKSQWSRFVLYTKILDKNRKISFKNAFPELYNLVKKYGYE